MSAFLVSALALAAAGSAAATEIEECIPTARALLENGAFSFIEAAGSTQLDASNAELQGLLHAIGSESEVPEGSKVTLFVPKDDVWPPVQDLPTGSALVEILEGHVVPTYLPSDAVTEALSDGPEQLATLASTHITASKVGEGVFVAASGQPLPGAQVVVFDIETCSGVVHIIDKVLAPSDDGTGSEDEPASCTSLADAISSNNLNRLGEAVLSVLDLPAAADLKTLATATEEIPEDQKITVFAPQDSAWPGQDVLATLDVLDVLEVHIVPLFLTSANVLDALAGGSPVALPTLLGSDVTASKVGGDVFVAAKGQQMPGAKAVAFDVQTCVGVVHVIDKVLLVSDEGMTEEMPIPEEEDEEMPEEEDEEMPEEEDEEMPEEEDEEMPEEEDEEKPKNGDMEDDMDDEEEDKGIGRGQCRGKGPYRCMAKCMSKRHDMCERKCTGLHINSCLGKCMSKIKGKCDEKCMPTILEPHPLVPLPKAKRMWKRSRSQHF